MTNRSMTPARVELRTPFENMRSLVESMDRMLAESLCPRAVLRQEGYWSPEFTLKEDGKKYTLVARLPGFEKTDVRVDVSERGVTVAGARRRSRSDRKHLSESTVSFQRAFSLPSAIKAGEAKATFSADTLTVELPKERETSARRIEIR